MRHHDDRFKSAASRRAASSASVPAPTPSLVREPALLKHVLRMESGLVRVDADVQLLKQGGAAQAKQIHNLNGRVDTLTGRVDTLTGRVDVLSVRVDLLDKKFDRMEVKLDKLLDKVGDLAQAVGYFKGGVWVAGAFGAAVLGMVGWGASRVADRITVTVASDQPHRPPLPALSHLGPSQGGRTTRCLRSDVEGLKAPCQ